MAERSAKRRRQERAAHQEACLVRRRTSGRASPHAVTGRARPEPAPGAEGRTGVKAPGIGAEPEVAPNRQRLPDWALLALVRMGAWGPVAEA
jgi:hypothetical protein